MSTVVTSTEPANVFFSYAHADEELREALGKHLSVLIRQGLITEWHDRCIVPGQEWAEAIDDHLHKADIVLLLVSSDFIASKYCWEVELKEALRRHESREACVIPVILRPVAWGQTLFSRLQALPKGAQAVTLWTDHDSAWVSVTEGIRSVVENLRQGLRPEPEQPFRPVAELESVRPAHEQQGASARKAILVLIEVIRDDPAIRAEAAVFRNEFKRLQQTIQKLGDHKDLHDSLHELQVDLFKPIINEANRFPDDQALECLAEYDMRLRLLVERIDMITCRNSFTKEQMSWMEKLYGASQSLNESIEQVDSEKLRLSIRLLKGVLAKQPSKVATRLNTLAGELQLKDLVKAMKTIEGALSPLGADAERISNLSSGAENLQRLNLELNRLLENHIQWQEVDDDLRRVEDCLEEQLEELFESWPDIQKKMSPLFGPAEDQENARFRTDGDKLDIAIKEKNPVKIRSAFRRYRAHGTLRFYEADRKLRDMCGSVGDSAELLNQVLQALEDDA